MMAQTAESTPLRNLQCPICGQSNACVPADTGSFAEPCWCSTAVFSARLLERVPTQLQGKSCICRACAERLKS